MHAAADYAGLQAGKGLFQKARQGLNEIGGRQAVLAQIPGASVSRRSVNPGGAGGSLQGRQSLPQKRCQKARQHVAAAAGGHAGISRGIFIPPDAVGNHRPVPF